MGAIASGVFTCGHPKSVRAALRTGPFGHRTYGPEGRCGRVPVRGQGKERPRKRDQGAGAGLSCGSCASRTEPGPAGLMSGSTAVEGRVFPPARFAPAQVCRTASVREGDDDRSPPGAKARRGARGWARPSGMRPVGHATSAQHPRDGATRVSDAGPGVHRLGWRGLALEGRCVDRVAGGGRGLVAQVGGPGHCATVIPSRRRPDAP